METTLQFEQFPANKWLKLSINGQYYIGRAINNERANLVATIDSGGKSVTFSWPYVCANATEVGIIDIGYDNK